MNVLLTSAGLENDKVKEFFQGTLKKESAKIKALFIPVAAIDVGAALLAKLFEGTT